MIGRRHKTRSLWAYYAAYVGIALVCLFLLTWESTRAFREFLVDHTEQELEARAYLIANYLEDTRVDLSAAANSCAELAGRARAQITIVAPTGATLCSSVDADALRKDLSLEPDVFRALQGKANSQVLNARGKKQSLIVAAVPVSLRDGSQAALRLGMELRHVERGVRDVAYRLVWAELVVVALVLFLGWRYYRRIDPPLREIQHGADQFAQGFLEERLPQYPIREVDDLAEALNSMAFRLNDTITRLTKAEQIRRDFVANVSHELKTPITSIKGFIETLLDGAIEDTEDARRFLRIVASQCERLTAIVEDLLVLARLESDNVSEILVLQEEHVATIVSSVFEVCRQQALEKRIALELDCSLDLTVKCDRSLIEQAIMNLVDNAIKYSYPDSTVTVRIRAEDRGVTIQVSDASAGIAPAHLPRLFERFYRVDKARSRNVGGTGLGLAIVKHIAGVHGGSVDVQSAMGVGSVFTITLPERRGGKGEAGKHDERNLVNY